jgi:diadenylate cyclase
MAVEVERYIVELGTEGRLIEMQLEETMVGVAADKTALIRDYSVEDSEENLATVLQSLARMPHQDVLDFGRLGRDARLRPQAQHPRLPSRAARYRSAGPHPAHSQACRSEDHHELGGLEEVPRGLRRRPRGRRRSRARRGPRTSARACELQEVDLVDRYLQS